MGCDGGTIPKRDELVRKKKKPEQKDKDAELSFRWQHCAISQEPLRQPVVACGLGRLYNKDAVIEAILDRTVAPEAARHIRSLKDVRDLRLTPNPAYQAGPEKGDGYVDHQTAPYICPVIGLEMNGKFKFVFAWGCGCVVSERALRAVKTEACHNCQQAFTAEDVVVLNAAGEDLGRMEANAEARRERARAHKKARRAEGSAKEAAATTPASDAPPSLAGASSSRPGGKPSGPGGPGDAPAKRPADQGLVDPQFKRTKGSYSVAGDPHATAVFKSLFTSHQSARTQTRAHWVTYNPFYN
ncbi:replication termination factor 2 isoform X2 [Bacillus rossius redtenbacheri]|uniref:replication termination factor 2 isoform X2 n=1 Tax=Bacillus rossius redtenbacheri TaxID=93214 RepID=UPI002FDDBF0F